MLHKTIKAVTGDVEQMSFNTAIARMMEFTNFFIKQEPRPRAAMEKFVLLLSPFAPHLAEELWQALGHATTLAYEPWPKFDEAAIREDTIEVPVQINGKLRGRIQVPADADGRRWKRPPARAQDRRDARRQDGGQDDRRAGANGELRGEIVPMNRTCESPILRWCGSCTATPTTGGW